jgi:hypothetical protein
VENRWSHQVPSFGNPAGGTTSYREKPSLTSMNTGQDRSCCLPRSAAVRPYLPLSAKPLRNGKAVGSTPSEHVRLTLAIGFSGSSSRSTA